MKIVATELDGVVIIEPQAFDDPRGFFMETYHQDKYRQAGLECVFVQDNLSFSVKNTLRGLHFQNKHPQAKLVQAITGEIFDVAVDIRPASATFGRWIGTLLSAANRHQMFIPEGFAHGFCVLSETAHVAYKCTDFYTPGDEGGIRWSDPGIAIDWPVKTPILSEKDSQLPHLSDLSLDAHHSR
ncbi:MAG: dTDP-4-dehydrorhamnose 3,5-epimerase [Desulfobacterales bacterium]|nr:MAG: dTDP-4-dehydrorhamnose 3,5-epimerase [Desulfobacterales bacterium]